MANLKSYDDMTLEELYAQRSLAISEYYKSSGKYREIYKLMYEEISNVIKLRLKGGSKNE